VATTAESFIVACSLADENGGRESTAEHSATAVRGHLLDYMLHLPPSMATWLHGQDSMSQQSGQGGSTRSRIMFARAVSHPVQLMELPVLVSKYLTAVVGGEDMLAVDRPWPSVCGCVAKTLELAQIPRICPLRSI
jgi:hypothetical protein